jgi:hypothetical protein
MALIDEVKKRVSAQRLIELTNPDEPNAATINDTILGYAINDTKAAFKTFVGVTCDDNDATHIAYAVDGVVIFLMTRAERWNNATREAEEKWYDKLDTLRLTVGGNIRLSPQTDSEMTPSKDKRGVSTTIVRPSFDPSKFDSIRPKPPFGSDTGESS